MSDDVDLLYDQGRHEEREAIIAWLLRGADPARRLPDDPWYIATPSELARRIRDGEHLR